MLLVYAWPNKSTLCWRIKKGLSLSTLLCYKWLVPSSISNIQLCWNIDNRDFLEKEEGVFFAFDIKYQLFLFQLVVIDNIGDLCLVCFRNCSRCGSSTSRWRTRTGTSSWTACGPLPRSPPAPTRSTSWSQASSKRSGSFSSLNHVPVSVMCCMMSLCWS